jgi:hypothetical protein
LVEEDGIADGGQATPNVLTTRVDWRHPGIDAHVGINGIGGNISVPVADHFNVRVGGEFFKYTTTFTEEGANVDATIQLGNGHAALDYFPWHNGFHISPLLVFANQTRVRGTVIVPAGQTVELNGSDYVSSAADPLHGSASVDTRKTAVGLTIGYGNTVPRDGSHWSFPAEIGFYYIGQPTLKVDFSGSACDPRQPAAIGCSSVTTDPDFQHDLAAFIARNNHNLSYASFFPVASFGVGYRF